MSKCLFNFNYNNNFEEVDTQWIILFFFTARTSRKAMYTVQKSHYLPANHHASHQ